MLLKVCLKLWFQGPGFSADFLLRVSSSAGKDMLEQRRNSLKGYINDIVDQLTTVGNQDEKVVFCIDWRQEIKVFQSEAERLANLSASLWKTLISCLQSIQNTTFSSWFPTVVSWSTISFIYPLRLFLLCSSMSLPALLDTRSRKSAEKPGPWNHNFRQTFNSI